MSSGLSQLLLPLNTATGTLATRHLTTRLSRPIMPHVFDPSDPSSPSSVPPSRTALLIMDVLGYTLAGTPSSDKALVTNVELRRWALEQGIAVVHCGFDVRRTLPFRSRILPQLEGLKSAFLADPGKIAEPEALRSPPHPLDITSNRLPGVVSALSPSGSDLDAVLRKKGIDSLIMVGISTSGCVLSTAKEATNFHYVVTVVKDGCADPQEDLHDVVLDRLLARHCHVVTLEELKGVWQA